MSATTTDPRPTSHATPEGVLLASMDRTMRTPMTAILGFADLIEQELPEDGDPTLREAVRTIQRNGRQLMGVIGAILDVSSVGQGETEPATDTVEITGLCRSILGEFASACDAKCIGLRCVLGGAVPGRILGDERRLRQMIASLLSNAVRCTDSGGVELRISTRSGPDDRSEICFDIIDSGIGMTEPQAAALLDPSAGAHDAGGVTVGLGAHLCRAYLRLLGGRMEVRTQLGAGSRIGVVLPLRTPTPDEAPADACVFGAEAAGRDGSAASREFLPLAGARILLVEDGPDNQALLRFLLHRAGADVELAADGQEALAFATDSGGDFDLVLMDMHMPRLDGYGATGRLRERGCELPVIALTANAMRGDRERCIAAGCDDYVAKPIDRLELIETCKQWMLGDRVRA